MTNSPDAHHRPLLRLSLFLGLVRFRALEQRYPGASAEEIWLANRAGSVLHSSADILGAAALADCFKGLVAEPGAAGMQAFIDRALTLDPATWLVAALRGRHALRAVMPAAAAQCFEFTGVFAETPTPEALSWWDSLVQTQRASENEIRTQRGRDGEHLTMRHELERLRALGVDQRPRWVALDDETLGYDVLSFDLDDSRRTVNVLIEVKACSSLPLRIFLTRNEWHRAQQAGESWRMHVWHLPSRTLTEVCQSELGVHVPLNPGAGAWQQVLSELS